MDDSIKKRIKKIIFERCNGSNKKFAELVGVGVSTVNFWDDEHIPKGDILQRIHTLLKVDLHWLLTGMGSPYVSEEPAGGRGGLAVLNPRDGVARTGANQGGNCRNTPIASGPDRESGFLKGTGLGESAEMFFRILASSDKNVMEAFIANLRAFYNLVEKNNSTIDRVTRLEQECDDLRQKLLQFDVFLRRSDTGSG